MSGLRRFLDKQKPLFQKGGKLSMFGSTFGMIDTFLFVPKHTTPAHGTQIRDANDLKRTMSVVVFALMPALFFGMYNVGYQHFLSVGDTSQGLMDMFLYGLWRVLPIIVVSYVSGGIIEVIFAQIKGHEINEGFLVTGMLIPMVMPIEAPLWIVALSTIFAVLIGKEVFGGTGMNIWNPALVARAFFFFAYPKKISGAEVWISGKGDVVSGATPLADAATLVGATPEQTGSILENMTSAWDMFAGFVPGSIGETSVIAILIGAFILIFTGVGSWRIMLSTVIGACVMGLIFNTIGVNAYMTEIPFWQHLLMGGFAFGAVFMATDPVTASQTNKGKWIYGFLIGFFAILIRVVNGGFPESMMLSILMMNTFAPLIDYYVIQGNINKRLKRAKAVAAA
ncbi:MAG: NADH:ubiquinone reductase (Na(+)-transporting) subunit B [Flavobacteriaceae bacterium]|nr:NADH:ubiquinone reductase (Na(+)-transporting) subunit B [Flavobacteriaceae bacterium]